MDAENYEDLDEKLAEMVANLSPEEYQRLGPGLREFGLAVAEFRQVQAIHAAARESLERAREDMDRAQERAENAFRLWRDAE